MEIKKSDISNRENKCVYSLSNGCSILNIKKCSGITCSFYKTLEDSKESQNKWCAHMRSISAEKQKQISRNYYGGKKIW